MAPKKDQTNIHAVPTPEADQFNFELEFYKLKEANGRLQQQVNQLNAPYILSDEIIQSMRETKVPPHFQYVALAIALNKVGMDLISVPVGMEFSAHLKEFHADAHDKSGDTPVQEDAPPKE